MVQKKQVMKHIKSSNLYKHEPIRKDKNNLKPKHKPQT
jgi:hypothetical protein